MPESTALPSHGSYLLPHLEHATVADAMHPGILSCEREATVADVARMMSTHHVHCVVVGGAGEGDAVHPMVWGMVSDLDLVRAGVHPDAPETAVELAQRSVATVSTPAPLRDAAELMLTHGTSHVVAVSPDSGRPVGILSTLDIAGVLGWGEM